MKLSLGQSQSPASPSALLSISLAIFVLFTVSFDSVRSDMATTESQETMYESSNTPQKKIIGMTTNGGGVVAAAAGAALMRGFQQKTLTSTARPAMESFDFITGMSGGNIIVALYGYSQSSNSNELLDVTVAKQSTIDSNASTTCAAAISDTADTDPSKITPKALKRKRSRKSFFHVATHSIVMKFLPVAGWGILDKKRQSVWPLMIWWTFLKPFGIQRNQNFGPKGSKEETTTLINPREDAHATPLINFLMVGEVDDGGRCFTDGFEQYKQFENDNKEGTDEVSNPSQVAKALAKTNNVTFVPFTSSPEHVGMGFSLDMKSCDGHVLAPVGKQMKPSEFGVVDSETQNKHRFSLELLLGAATDLIPYQELRASQDPNLTPTESDKILSQGNAFAVERQVQFGNNVVKNMLFADGGTLYGPGTEALVREGANTIFIPMWLTGARNQYSVVYQKTQGKSLRVWLDEMWWGVNTDSFGVIAPPSPGMNHIFDDGLIHMQALREAYDALYLADKTLIMTLKSVKVIDNPYHGIKGGGLVDITFLYVTMPQKFALAVPAKSVPPPKGVSTTVDELGRFTNVEFQDFPNLDTWNHKAEFDKTSIFNIVKKIRLGLSIFSLSTRQANMMIYLGNYLINEAWDGVSIDGKEYFAGFDDFFS